MKKNPITISKTCPMKDNYYGDEKERMNRVPPPTHSVISFILIAFLAIAMMVSKEELDENATIDLFTHRLFPDLLSLQGLVFVRTMFAIFIWGITILTVFFDEGWITQTTYVSTSKLSQSNIVMRGIHTQFPYTSVTWNLLGCSMASSAFIAYQATASRTSTISPWLLRFSLLCWEATAPNTLLVSAVVKYVIWPGCLKRNGTSANCRSWRSLIWHNANAAMSLSEAFFLGGLPVYVSHISISIILGCVYVLFSWCYMYSWPTTTTAIIEEAKVTKKGRPNFLYFFMDTTLGWTATYSIYALLLTLMVFQFLFAMMGKLLFLLSQHQDDDDLQSKFLIHLFFGILIFGAVCRFRD